MRKVLAEVLGGIFVLILLYLFFTNGEKSVALINAIATNSISGIKVLQGRPNV